MAYGRLEVYFPDGRLETYMLDDDTVSVGRADGNTIALDTDTISRYHFSIIYHASDNESSITDLESANGTFVDGVQLQSNTPHRLGDVEEISVGSLRIIYRQVDNSPTVMMTTLDEETQQMEVGASQLRVDVDYTQLQVWPSASSSAELAITNLSQETRDFSIQVSGLPTGWLRLTRPEIQLDANETAYILVNVKPPRRPNTVPRHYEVTIEVAPVDQPSLAVYTYMDVEIKPYSGFGMVIGQQVDVGDAVPIFLHNQGSGTMRFTVSAKDRENALVFRGPQAPLELQAGQRLQINLHIDAKLPALVGQEQTHKFVVQVQSHDASRFIAAQDGQVTIGPRIPTWGAIAAVGIALSVLIIALLALLGVLNPPDPVIDELRIVENTVAQGEPLVLEIDASRVDTFDILVDQSVLASDLSGELQTFTLETDNLTGRVEIVLIARNGSRTTRATVVGRVYSFTVTPTSMLRNTASNLTLEWDIPNATIVKFSGLSDFTNQLIQSSTEFDPTDTQEFAGIATQTLQITLLAEDSAGNVIFQETQTIAVDNPECVANVDVPIHEGPDTSYQQVATVPIGRSVIVLAQDVNSGWLSLELAQGLRGWGLRDSFDCNANFDVSTLRQEANIPDLPTPTATPAVTITPILVPTLVPTAEASGN